MTLMNSLRITQSRARYFRRRRSQVHHCLTLLVADSMSRIWLWLCLSVALLSACAPASPIWHTHCGSEHPDQSHRDPDFDADCFRTHCDANVNATPADGCADRD